MYPVRFELSLGTKESGDKLWFYRDDEIPFVPLDLKIISFCGCCSPYKVDQKVVPPVWEVHNRRFVATIFLDWSFMGTREAIHHFTRTGWTLEDHCEDTLAEALREQKQAVVR